MEAGFGAVFWFSSSMGCKEGFILMKQVKDSATYVPRQQMSHPLNKG
jgi:hypothetical protein